MKSNPQMIAAHCLPTSKTELSPLKRVFFLPRLAVGAVVHFSTLG